MRLYHLHEEEDNQPVDPFWEWLSGKVKHRIMRGDSQLKTLIRGSGVTLDHVREAIRKGDCLRSGKPGEKSLGPTYFEQTISNLLRDMANDNELSLDRLNDARSAFGLTKMNMKRIRAGVDLPMM